MSRNNENYPSVNWRIILLACGIIVQYGRVVHFFENALDRGRLQREMTTLFGTSVSRKTCHTMSTTEQNAMALVVSKKKIIRGAKLSSTCFDTEYRQLTTGNSGEVSNASPNSLVLSKYLDVSASHKGCTHWTLRINRMRPTVAPKASQNHWKYLNKRKSKRVWKSASPRKMRIITSKIR